MAQGTIAQQAGGGGADLGAEALGSVVQPAGPGSPGSGTGNNSTSVFVHLTSDPSESEQPDWKRTKQRVNKIRIIHISHGDTGLGRGRSSHLGVLGLDATAMPKTKTMF